MNQINQGDFEEKIDEFSEQDAADILSSSAGRRFLETLKYRLAVSRMEVDTVSPDRLLTLQGRIATFKETIDLLED